MKRFLFVTTFNCLLTTACGDLLGSQNSIEGKWGMVSGGIKKNGLSTSDFVGSSGSFRTTYLNERSI